MSGTMRILHLVGLAILLTVNFPAARAEYWSNMGGETGPPELKKVSTSVFDALSHTFVALSLIEAGNLKDGDDFLEKALGILREATAILKEVRANPIVEEQLRLELMSESDRDEFIQIVQSYDFKMDPFAISVGNLLEAAERAISTTLVAISAFKESPNIESYRLMRREISRCLAFGELSSLALRRK